MSEATSSSPAPPPSTAEESSLSPEELEKKKKKEAKKAAKDAEKAAKELEKANKAAAQAAASARPLIIIENGGTSPNDFYGDYALVQSKFKDDRVYQEIDQLNASSANKQVWVRARLHNVRSKSSKLCFLVLRRGFYTVQAVISADSTPADEKYKEMAKFASKISNESVVDIYGVVSVTKDPISTTQSDIEIIVQKIFVVSLSNPLPFQLEDASRPISKEEAEADFKKSLEKKSVNSGSSYETNNNSNASAAQDSNSKVTVGQEVRLDNRWVDLRTPANSAIFRVQSRIGQYFREYFINRDFVEIHSPKIIPGVSEGGANVFKLDYFGTPVCLAQSPQLYKQMAVLGDLRRVFEIGPVFRAENSNTHRHMCEFVGMDFEMEINQHYSELLEVLYGCLVYVFDNVNKTCAKELAAINAQYPFEPLKYNPKPFVFSFKEAVKLLREDGVEIDDFEDFSTPQEKRLGVIVKEKFGVDFYIVDKYPLGARPFYTMPCPDDPRYTNSYDVFVRGEEITSGSQRVHDVALLTKRAAECGIPAEGLAAYCESFKYGAFPHGGAGIGLERVVMLFLGLDNIRKTSMFPRTPLRCAP